MATKSSKKRDVAKYEPNEHEARVVSAIDAQAKARPRAPKFKMVFDEDERTNFVGFDHKDEVTAQYLAMHEMGTADGRFYAGLLKQIAALGEHGKIASEDASNFALSVIRAVDPKDELETMLATQMATVHQATMMMARRLNHVENLPQQDAAERAFNKLARTYSVQMDTLKRYRAKAQQTVRVERVTVNEGGQAIVGAVETGGRGDEQK